MEDKAEAKSTEKVQIVEDVLLENISGAGTHETCSAGGSETCETVIRNKPKLIW